MYKTKPPFKHTRNMVRLHAIEINSTIFNVIFVVHKNYFACRKPCNRKSNRTKPVNDVGNTCRHQNSFGPFQGVAINV